MEKAEAPCSFLQPTSNQTFPGFLLFVFIHPDLISSILFGRIPETKEKEEGVTMGDITCQKNHGPVHGPARLLLSAARQQPAGSAVLLP